MNFINFHFLLLFYLKTIHISCKTVSLKFDEFYERIKNSKNLSLISNDISIYSHLYDYLLYTIINIGEPNQLILGIFNSDSNVFVINNNDNCHQFSQYNYSYTNSKTSEIIRKSEGDPYFPGYLILNETIQFETIENSHKKKEIIKDYQFKFEEPKKSWGKEDNPNKLFCADIGFQINREKKEWTQFLKKFKDRKIIDSYKITMNYTSNNEGYFYIGDFPHEYDPISFKEFQLISTYSIPRNSFCQFRIIMDNIYSVINETKIFKVTYNEVFFHLELGLIVCPVDYFNFIKNVFFKDYLNNSICNLELMTKDLNTYYMIICKDDISFKIKEFPSIYFNHSELNKTFILDYNDIFYYKNNKYYFLVIYSSFSGSYWKLGKPFLKKYQITLDLDSKKIYFYDNMKIVKKEEGTYNKGINSPNLKEILIIASCFIFFIILFLALLKVIKKNRKKRANELKDDEYEYEGLDNNGTDKDRNQIINAGNNSTIIN